MSWFEYRQNNSGGRFKAPAVLIAVEAPDAEAANKVAKNLGVYFDGCEEGRDCDCCGDRWHTPWGHKDAKPAPYDTSESYTAAWAREAGASTLYVFADGSTETVPAP